MELLKNTHIAYNRNLKRVGLGTLILATMILVVIYHETLISLIGFSFLEEPTNWRIGFSFLPHKHNDPYWWTFAVGLGNTIVSAAIAIFMATLLGFIISLSRLSPNPVLSAFAGFYVNIIRNIPVVLQAMFWYAVYLSLPATRDALSILGARVSNRGFYIPAFEEPITIGVFVAAAIIAAITVFSVMDKLYRHSLYITTRNVVTVIAALASCIIVIYIIPNFSDAARIDWPEKEGLNFAGGIRFPIEFSALVTAVLFYRGAYIAEIFRGGFKAVPHGMLDAAHALSLSRWATLTKIRLPIALITIITPLTSEFIIVVKITSIGILIGFAELYAVSSNATQIVGNTIQIMIIMTISYLIVNYTVVSIMNVFNRRIAFKGLAK